MWLDFDEIRKSIVIPATATLPEIIEFLNMFDFHIDINKKKSAKWLYKYKHWVVTDEPRE